ncbi:hypothetical protein SISNIDRAFT_457738 [Sistotremastrum niveocremeum HHB9708]|uniref:Uncharacterized protein n=1 Tax=Sistotremastrum niveocremeum HHB9708 TaxID=1314777 RepID=A0A164R3W9_9AGAM|nr:hypothetical protein SISNIDRAFT_457738 [Sistotremastrum niveocremeum HHB9708]
MSRISGSVVVTERGVQGESGCWHYLTLACSTKCPLGVVYSLLSLVRKGAFEIMHGTPNAAARLESGPRKDVYM